MTAQPSKTTCSLPKAAATIPARRQEGVYSNRQRFLDACHCRPVDRPPVWLMRQAGRALPEYRALKEKYTFLQLVQTPDLAVEVTLQPIRRFDFDAAILFSDILVVPFALGQEVRFEEGHGPVLGEFAGVERAVRDAGVWAEKLAPVYQAMRETRAKLAPEKALIGFAGAPWTLAAYMLEGKG